ncbi:MAG: UDP-4-amino-4,6-dideoxy-N-acetyl-beta-L-altrosamine transaminase [Deltaproteobacteria bacterium]|nr:UDP-4-amino-4,6-dideoxy-N-acetyl-beta-L-altrosamine transaminase [Deltaproteobacteria bacterium]
MIPYGKQDISKQDIEKVLKVLSSDMLTQGPIIPKFEQALAKYCKAKYAVAVSSGTAALHLAYIASEIGDNDIIWTTPNTFAATANAALYCGAKPDFIDINPNTYNISVEKLEEKLIQAKKDNKLPKAIIPVHFAGQAAELKKIDALSRKYGFAVIEDAAHAIGTKYKDGKYIGDCKYSNIAAFSFHPVKTITTGEGGAAVTNNKKTYKKLLMLRSHGIIKTDKMIEKYGQWHYQMQALGFNYRITDIQAALGISQLNRLNRFITKRRKIIRQYNEAFKNIQHLTIPYEKEKGNSAFHLYVLQINFKKIKKSRKQIMKKLAAQNIGTQVHYIPVYRHPYYKKLFGYDYKKYPATENYYKKALSIPLYPKMTDLQIEYVIEKIIEIFK